MNKELAKTLTTALVQFIDKHIPEGTMCCSNAECESVKEMFEGGKLDIIEAFIQKKLSRLTEFEQALSNYLKNDFEYFHTKKWDEQKWNDVIRTQSKELLALAKKELCNGCNANLEGYIKGQQDAKRQYDESVAYHFPIMPQRPLCYEPGGTCTNPHHDCINCPAKYSSGGTITTPNTQSGTSTSTLHGSTSVTDGKEHNSSFID